VYLDGKLVETPIRLDVGHAKHEIKLEKGGY
jgi:hypothetical protein